MSDVQWVPEDWERGLAVVAHPDDLDHGAASAIARWTDQGKWVGYVLATAGEAGIDGIRPDIAGPLVYRPAVLILCNYAERWGFGELNFADHRAVGLAAVSGAAAGVEYAVPFEVIVL